MLKRPTKTQEIMGQTLPEPRITPMAIWLVFLWIGLPILVVGGVLDFAVQILFGVCTGLWCLAG